MHRDPPVHTCILTRLSTHATFAGAADADAATQPLVPPEVEEAIADVMTRVDECCALEEALKREVAAAQRNLLSAKT
eukprot:365198-Chlamydomonas_euryale.AAC.2